MAPKVFAVFDPGDHVFMSDRGVEVTGGPRMTGIVVGYGAYKGHAGFLKIRYEHSGTEDLVAPWLWQREKDGVYGKSPDLALPSTLKAIETIYRGFRARSRAEARWMCFWDALGIKWEYENQGFNLPSGPYLPDFWLPEVAMWAEVKPGKFSISEENKCFELVTLTGYPCLTLDGIPKCKHFLAAMPVEDPCGAVQEFREFALTNQGQCAVGGGKFPCNPGGELYRDTLRAVEAARSARFEHGESGMSVDAEVRLRT